MTSNIKIMSVPKPMLELLEKSVQDAGKDKLT
jgi:hypothetical protein